MTAPQEKFLAIRWCTGKVTGISVPAGTTGVVGSGTG